MSTATEDSLKAYRSASLDASIAVASPHQLVLLLFQGVRVALAKAQRAIERKDAAARSVAISKAIAIIDDGLHASLDTTRGGVLAERLHDLYAYMVEELVVANVRSDAPKIAEIDRLLGELEDAWRQIGMTPSAANRAQPAAAEQPKRASVSYGKA